MMGASVASASLGFVRDSVDGSSMLATRMASRCCFYRCWARTVWQAIDLFMGGGLALIVGRGCVAQVLEVDTLRLVIRETGILGMFSQVGSLIVLHGESSMHDSIVLGVLGLNWWGAYAAVFPSGSSLIGVPEQRLTALITVACTSMSVSGLTSRDLRVVRLRMSVWAPVSATAWVLILGELLDLEMRVCLFVELESHWECWRGSGRGFYPVGRVGVELHVWHWDLD